MTCSYEEAKGRHVFVPMGQWSSQTWLQRQLLLLQWGGNGDGDGGRIEREDGTGRAEAEDNEGYEEWEAEQWGAPAGRFQG